MKEDELYTILHKAYPSAQVRDIMEAIEFGQPEIMKDNEKLFWERVAARMKKYSKSPYIKE